MANDSHADDRPTRLWRGSSKRYLLERLKEAGRDDLIEAIAARRISARSAAVGMGWLREYQPKGAGDNRTQRRQFEMTQVFGKPGLHRVVVMQELTFGPGQMGSVFQTPEEGHTAWLQYRDEILSDWDHPARRPEGFYRYEVECSSPDYDIERSLLWRLDLLSEQERLAIEDEWRVAFRRAYENGLDVARRKQYWRWADIPVELSRKWSVERKRSARTVRKLAASTPEPAVPPRHVERISARRSVGPASAGGGARSGRAR